MRFSLRSFVIAFAIAACGHDPVAAHPGPSPDDFVVARAVNCKVVTGVLGVVKALGTPATSFCSSFLHIPATSTIQATITPTQFATFTASPILITVTDPNCVPAPSRRAVAKLDKRGVPPALKAFAAGEISSACACLSLKPKATKTITTTGSPVTVTTTLTPTSTICTSCTPVGQPCIFEYPELCCSQTCACISGVCNCFQL